MSCGQTLTKGIHTLNHNLYCSGGVGLRLTEDDTVLNCQGHAIRNMSGIQNGIGIVMGGPSVEQSRWGITIRDCVVTGFRIGVLDHNDSHSIVVNTTPRQYGISGNIFGIISDSVSNTHYINLDLSYNRQIGWHCYSCFNAALINSATNDSPIGVQLVDTFGGLFRHIDSLRNENVGVVFTGTNPPFVTTQQIYLYDSFITSALFARGARNNSWCRSDMGTVTQLPGAANNKAQCINE